MVSPEKESGSPHRIHIGGTAKNLARVMMNRRKRASSVGIGLSRIVVFGTKDATPRP
jgi:hypothetical protein